MRRYAIFSILPILFLSFSCLAKDQIEIDVQVPKLVDADPYFRPYVAIWIENTERDPIKTLALWYQIETENVEEPDGKKWLKDLRQWWRKLGRNGEANIDAVTGATRKPGNYKIISDLSSLDAGEYLLNVEAAREEGGRSYKRVKINVPNVTTHAIEADIELGSIKISGK